MFSRRGQDDYAPNNHDNQFMGIGTVRLHLDLSRNIPAVKALEAATPQAVADRARELGYDVAPYYALALGSFEATPLQHASAMSAFANDGTQVEAHFITRVEDSEGNLLYDANPRRTQVWSPQTAYIMLDLMHGNVTDRNPTAFSWRAGIDGRWVAGKTGTTNDEKDIWFVGMTPGMVSAVWIGYDDSRSLPRSMTLADGTVDQENSSRQPIYVWKSFVESALRGTPSSQSGFPVPEGIVFESIDLRTGVPTAGGTRAAFRASTDLRQQGLREQVIIEIPVDTQTGLRATVDTPPDRIEIVEVAPDEIDRYLQPAPTGRD